MNRERIYLTILIMVLIFVVINNMIILAKIKDFRNRTAAQILKTPRLDLPISYVRKYPECTRKLIEEANISNVHIGHEG